MTDELQHPVNIRHKDERTLGERVSDAVAAGMGSWRFVIGQNFIILGWIVLNLIEVFFKPWDPYPFILLNLVMSWQAANSAPVIMMSQNRQSAKDRDLAEHTYTIELEMKELIQQDLNLTRAFGDLTREVHEHIIGENSNQGAKP